MMDARTGLGPSFLVQGLWPCRGLPCPQAEPSRETFLRAASASLSRIISLSLSVIRGNDGTLVQLSLHNLIPGESWEMYMDVYKMIFKS